MNKNTTPIQHFIHLHFNLGRSLRSGLRRVAGGICFLASLVSLAAAGLGPGFTFQGQLVDGGQPAQGRYDFLFTLYDDADAGQALGLPETHTAITVAQGRFTVVLNATGDFGPDAFPGESRWLEIQVRTNSSDSAYNFVALLPRQPLLAAPQAGFALRSGQAAFAEDAGNAVTADFAHSADWAADAQHAEHAIVADSTPHADHATTADTAASVEHAVTADTAAVAASVPWMGVTDVLTGFGLGVGPNKELRVNFEGDGVAETAARSDHQHFGEVWSESTPGTGLIVQNLDPYGIAIRGKLDQYGSGFEPVSAGVFGDAASGPGVAGYSNTGPGVHGWTSAINIDAPAVLGENNATVGSVVFGHAKAATGSAAGILGMAESKDGVGVKGVAPATINAKNYGGWFEAGSGSGVYAKSLHGHAGQFSVTNVNNSVAALEVETYGRGSAATFDTINSQNNDVVVSAWGNGSGETLKAVAAGDGGAGSFVAIGNGRALKLTSGNGIGLDVSTTGNKAINAVGGAMDTISAINTGNQAAVSGNSPSGRGLEGYSSTGSAIYGRAPNGNALEVDGGAIKVTGAGLNTSTAVFIHQCTAENTPATGPSGNPATVIDNPFCNNHPDAILFVTPRTNIGVAGDPTGYEGLGVRYSTAAHKWVLWNTSLDEVGDFDEGDTFNILVILP